MILPFFSIVLRLLLAAAFLLFSLAAARAQSDTAETPPDQPATDWILPPTNSVSSSFLESHPDLEQTPPPTLSLHSGAAPEPSPSEAESAPADERFVSPEGSPEELPAHLLVVYNSSDPASKSLAEYYARRREIPAERVLGINCSMQEEVSRAEYESTIREPIISYIYQKNWMERRSVPVRVAGRVMDLLVATRNDVWAMVLMRGVPLRIAEDPTLQGSLEDIPPLQTNAAAVDSELALLPIFGLPAGGFVPNAFFDRAGTGFVRAGPELATKLILVTRLDGPRPADVRRMIDDSLYAEENRLAGLAVIDTRGLTDVKNNYTVGDNWLRSSREMLLQNGWSVRFDENPDVLPVSDPCDRVALYLGWYHAGATGPWITPPNRFVRGAIAYHLHSFSATTVRSATDAWVGPLIAHGAAATMGCVYEPYLDLTPHLNIFTRRLLDGDYFAEAAYASEKGLSWMVTVVGDPLYRPFRKSVDAALAGGGPETSDHAGWLLLQQVQLAIGAHEIPDNAVSLEHYLDVPGAVAQEGLGDLLDKLGDAVAVADAERAYREAATLDVQPVDCIRVGLKLAQLEENHGKGDEAQNELNELREEYPVAAPRFGVPSPLAATGSDSPPLTLRPAPSPVDLNALPQPPGPPKPPSPK
jgi:uncharacterized protein (TIGR03790 family)